MGISLDLNMCIVEVNNIIRDYYIAWIDSKNWESVDTIVHKLLSESE